MVRALDANLCVGSQTSREDAENTQETFQMEENLHGSIFPYPLIPRPTVLQNSDFFFFEGM